MDDSEKPDLFSDFDRFHALAVDPVVRQAERRVLGSDYGATSYTTLSQADELATLLGLSPRHLLLDLGTGTGWPGLYLARTTGCRVVLTDVPAEGLRVARERAIRDGLEGRSGLVVSSADALPFQDRSFDAVTHTDVLC